MSEQLNPQADPQPSDASQPSEESHRSAASHRSRDNWLSSSADGAQLGQLPANAWRRVHPLSPLLQTIGFIVAVALIAIYNLVDVIDVADEIADGWSLRILLIIVGGLLIFLLLVGGWLWLAWTRTRFAVDERAIYFQQGVLAKQQRVARLNRVQAVDIVQPLVARIFGLARLDIEVAGGADSKIQISYLKLSEARALRDEILGQVKRAKAPQDAVGEATTGSAAGPLADVLAETDAPAELEYQMLQVPPGRLIASSLLSSSTVAMIIVLLLGMLPLFIARGMEGVIIGGGIFVAVILPLLFALVAVVWSQLNSGYNFRLSVGLDGVRVRRGLLETRSQTIAPGRIQAVQLHQGIIWRMLGWWKVQVNVAGYGVNTENASTVQTVLLPVGDRDQALTALWTVLPDLGSRDVLATLDAALEGSGNDAGFMTSPQRARWLDPIAWRHNGVLLTQTATIIRRNRFRRTVTFIPHARVQSVRLSQGPLERRLRLVDFASHSVPGPILNLRAIHLEPELGKAIMEMQAERIVQEKRRESIEQWQRRMGLVS